MAAPQEDDAKLQLFLQWLQANGGQLRCCTINNCGPNKGFGAFISSVPSDDGIYLCIAFRLDSIQFPKPLSDFAGVAMVVPLDLAITPMRVIQDPFIGPRCRALFEEGNVDDRFLMMLFLTIERLRLDSLWKPYLDMLPKTFGNPLWFTEDELAELKGTTLHRASFLQMKNLQALFDDKIKVLVDELLPCDDSIREVQFEDFLWANSVFWSRALNIPFPRTYVFPESLGSQGSNLICHNGDCGAPVTETAGEAFHDKNYDNITLDKENDDEASRSKAAEIVWVEGLVPGIDFCNHGLKPVATWEVDQMGCMTGISPSMYLMIAVPGNMEIDKEISISYGNKGNEELLYLYGFVIDNNPDDFLMVHYPIEALQNGPLSEGKEKLLELQKAELRCLLPKSLLDKGLFSDCHKKDDVSQLSSFSWSGQRKVPSYLHKLIFPQEFMAALRTIAMQDFELRQAKSLLEELVESKEERQASESEVQAAVWESCGDYAALELLVDLLHVKMMDLEEGSGSEEHDAKLLKEFHSLELEENLRGSSFAEDKRLTVNRWSCIVYRRGQKQLARLFLREAERALELCAIGQQ